MIETAIITTLFKKEMICQTITNTTKTAYNEITDLMSNKDFLFKSILEDLDLIEKIGIIDSLIKSLELDEINDTVNLSLHSLHNIIDKINNEISKINEEIINHNKKWFSSIRPSQYLSLVERLKIHKKIMDERLDLLLKLLPLKTQTLK
jgi:hypothetical protein